MFSPTCNDNCFELTEAKGPNFQRNVWVERRGIEKVGVDNLQAQLGIDINFLFTAL